MDVVKCLSGWYGDRRGGHEEECLIGVDHTRTSLSPTPSLSVVITIIIGRIRLLASLSPYCYQHQSLVTGTSPNHLCDGDVRIIVAIAIAVVMVEDD